MGFTVPDMDTISPIGVGFAATRRVWNVRKFSAVPSIVDILGQRFGVETQQAGLHSIVVIPRTSCSTTFCADHGIYEAAFAPKAEVQHSRWHFRKVPEADIIKSGNRPRNDAPTTPICFEAGVATPIGTVSGVDDHIVRKCNE